MRPMMEVTTPMMDGLEMILIWVVLGALFFWVLGMVGEAAFQKVKPIIPFIIITGVVGAVVYQALLRMF